MTTLVRKQKRLGKNHLLFLHQISQPARISTCVHCLPFCHHRCARPKPPSPCVHQILSFWPISDFSPGVPPLPYIDNFPWCLDHSHQTISRIYILSSIRVPLKSCHTFLFLFSAFIHYDLSIITVSTLSPHFQFNSLQFCPLHWLFLQYFMLPDDVFVFSHKYALLV